MLGDIGWRKSPGAVGTEQLLLLWLGDARSGGTCTVADRSQRAVGIVLHLGRVGCLTETSRTPLTERWVYQ